MARQSRARKETIGRVMHEFKHGELKTRGRPVRNPKQAIAIALSEAGTSNKQDPAEKRRSQSRTKARERRGDTAQARAEGGRRQAASGHAKTRAELYEEAKRRDIPGRSRMSKAELERALRHH